MTVRRCLISGVIMAAVPVCAAWAADPCVVAVDTGHSRAQGGAVSARGVDEWHFNRALATQVILALEAEGIRTLDINPDGGPIGLKERPAAAQQAGARLFLSIHHDSVQSHYLSQWQVDGRSLSYSDRFSGYGLFVSAKNPAFQQSQWVAARIGDNLVAAGQRPTLHHAEAIAGENRPLLDEKRGIYRYDDLIVLKYAAMPAVLVEAGVIVNRTDETRIQSPAYRALLAGAIAGAALDYCASVEKSGAIR